ncbi:MAG TPA: T9SS type A sorting domain-containing protein [Cyclobacteriaceae bacterium]|nr:T9SS type A sorting domain-containing protein [Cyclobacteriaceae bacterium]
MRTIAVVLIALVISMMATAQKKESGMVMMKPPKGTVCYASRNSEFTNIGPPAEYIRAMKARASGASRTNATNIIVTYEGFTSEAKAAFQEAVDIWETIIQTPVTIRVHAQWKVLGENVLGSASPSTYVVNLDEVQKKNIWYPIALAEKIAGRELNDTNDPDIVASFNSTGVDWHYSLSSAPPANKHDLITIVMHEIGHGLGITHAYSVDNGQGFIADAFNDRPVIYETNIRASNGKNLVNDFTPPSTALKDVLTSNNLFYSTPLVRAANSNNDAVLFAPSTYDPGSSVAHLNEATYTAGSVNSLMTPAISDAERILDPGPIVRAILKEIGWTGTVLKHAPLKSTENTTGPYHAVVKVASDNGYDANTVTLNYKTTGSSFTPVVMNATGNANEFAADLPAGSPKYTYFVSVKDVDQRTFTYPGTTINPGSPPAQNVIVFEAGPDTKPPFINHTPREFATVNDGLELEAIVSDNLQVANVRIEWKIKGVAQPDRVMTLKAGTDSTYILNIALNGFVNTGDKIEYRIRAEDNSIAHNFSYKPSPTTFYEVNVAGLGDTQNSYANNFDDLSAADFFGNGFTVSKPDGFNTGAIHSEHPYQAGGADGVTRNFIYNLTVPVRLRADDAILKFDEIVLVEPGEAGSKWPDAEFFDYVIVEGSTDGGVTWKELADGYDATFNAEWNSLWNSTLSNNNSTGTGTPALYKTHSFDLLSKFNPGDEVAFRFRLFSDPFSFGWGWSIDNLKIQIDDVPPQILHQHYDFVLTGTTTLDIKTKVTDKYGIAAIFVDYNVNGNNETTSEIIINPTTDTYTQTIDFAALGAKAGDELQYRIRATDNNGNKGAYPIAGFIRVAGISLTTGIDQLVTDFSSPAPDLAGNFFDVEQPAGFTKRGITSGNPYLPGMGLDLISEYAWMTRKPVKINVDNPRVHYEDVAIVEYNGSNVKDYVVVEASKDGTTWEALVSPYAANAETQWKTIFDNSSSGTQGVVRKHMADITAGGKFHAGDLVLIRFRLHSEGATTGWGWYVTNLSIQGPITGLEPATATATFTAWPNPVVGESLHLAMALPAESEVSVEIISTQGQVLSADRFSAPAGEFQRDYEVGSWPPGFYVVKLRSDFGTSIQKVIKAK